MNMLYKKLAEYEKCKADLAFAISLMDNYGGKCECKNSRFFEKLCLKCGGNK